MSKEGASFASLRASIRRKEFSPVYLLHGAESLLADEACGEIVDAALAPEERDFNLDVLRAGDVTGPDIAARAAAFPLMGQRRVVVVRDVDKLSGKNDVEALASYVDDPSPSTVLILLGEKPGLNKRPYATISRKYVALACAPLWENEAGGWIERRVEQRGKRIDGDAAKMLTAYVGTSLRELSNEIEKLFLFVGERKAIAAADVIKVVGASKEFSVFELQNAVGVKNIGRAATIIHKMVETGGSMPFAIVMLTNYLTAVWKVRGLLRQGKTEKDLAALAKIHPSFVRQYVAAAERFSAAQVDAGFQCLVDADEQLKSSGGGDEEIMQAMLVRLLGIHQEAAQS